MKCSRIRCAPWAVLFLATILITSCVPQRKLRYLQKDQAAAVSDSIRAKVPVHVIAPHDLLYVQIISATTDLNKIPGFETSPNFGADASVYLQGYPVDDDGYLNLPVLGKHHVQGMKIDELQDMLTSLARQKILLDADVFVKVINKKVTVIGEVKTPGVIRIYDERITIFEALAITGDLTSYGNRTNVMLIREVNGKQEVFLIDLTQKNLVNSPWFYLQNQDVLYVQPLDAKSYGFAQLQWGVIFSSFSTLLALIAILYK